ncbi:MAG: 2-isopropylmalate synthase [Clostridiales bacterium]|jgi:isopropylmalate/homocitrate/citramalate synthase|nr:2-isopropylmalate synthase [Clostridiales bacterium]
MEKHELTKNKKTGLLERREHDYVLRDVAEPELFRGIFDFDEVPKIVFNDRHVPQNTPEEIWITDTTFRDGQQSTAPFTVDQIATVYEMLSKLGGKKGIIRQSEFFLYSQKDRDALIKCREKGLKFPEITSWIRANPDDFRLVKDLQIKETGILVSCSDYHIFNKMKLTRRSTLDKYLAIVKEALNCGIVPRCHFEDITRADFYGFVIPFANELMQLSRESGIPIKIRACDTLGYGVTYPGASLPRSVQGIIYGLNYYAEVPSEQLEWHGHNDFYKVVTNAATAWLYGCSSVNCSVLGIGERTGNCPTEAMCIEYAQLKGTADGMDLSMITTISDYFEHEIGYLIPPRTPFVGRSFNATRAGIHADGMLKNPEIYNIFNTEKILGRKPMVSINNTSGLAGIAYWMNSYYELTGGDVIDKSAPIVAKVKALVDKEYEGGRITVMGDDELDTMVRLSDKRFHKLLDAGATRI